MHMFVSEFMHIFVFGHFGKMWSVFDGKWLSDAAVLTFVGVVILFRGSKKEKKVPKKGYILFEYICMIFQAFLDPVVYSFCSPTIGFFLTMSPALLLKTLL